MEAQKEQIELALDVIRPFLKADGGDVELVTIEDDVVKLRLLGACQSCDISHMTMKAGIENAIKKVVPQIKEVVAVN